MIGPCRQVELIEPDSEALLVCWLPINEMEHVKVGSKIELKGMNGRIWTVGHIYKMTVNDIDLKKSWHVGGIA